MTTTERPPRFLRTRRGRLIGGVCSGLGHYFRVDPLLFRIAFVAVAFFGGAGLIVYLAFLLLVPEEGARRAPIRVVGRSWAGLSGAVALIVAAALGIDAAVHALDWDQDVGVGLGFVALGGAAAAALWWWLGRGRAEGAPGSPDRRMWRHLALGTAVSAAVGLLFAFGGYLAGVERGVAGWALAGTGAALAVAALAGRARWFVLVPALAFAVPVTLVTAADADLHGGVGDRVYRPDSVAELREGYELGAGRLEVDLRDVRLPAGDTTLRLRVGLGEVVLLVPEEVCVSARARVGGGYVGVLDRDGGGLDSEWSNDSPRPPAGTPRLVVDGEVGMGALFVADRPFEHDGRRGGGFRPGDYGTNDACRQGGDA